MWYNVGDSNMSMLAEIRVERDEIYAIARKRKAERLWGFGSCASKGLSCHEPHAAGGPRLSRPKVVGRVIPNAPPAQADRQAMLLDSRCGKW